MMMSGDELVWNIREIGMSNAAPLLLLGVVVILLRFARNRRRNKLQRKEEASRDVERSIEPKEWKEGCGEGEGVEALNFWRENWKEEQKDWKEEQERREMSKAWKDKGMAKARALGPSVCTVEFVTSTAPNINAKKTGLFAPTNYKSIERKLVLDVRNLTWARLHPKNTVTLIQKQQEDQQEKELQWHTKKHRVVVPVGSVANVTAVPPLKGAVLHLDVHFAENSDSGKSVTMDNWAEGDYAQHDNCPTVLHHDLLAKAILPSTPTQRSPSRIHETTEEHTFGSPWQAANFQFTLLALKTVGSHINNMYTALELLRIASPDYSGQDTILLNTIANDTLSEITPARPLADAQKPSSPNTDKTESPTQVTPKSKNSKPTTAGIAYDDVLRSLSGMPSLAPHIHRIRTDKQSKSNPNTLAQQEQTLITSAADTTPTNSTKLQYKNKRLILGYVDFFRIFVPNLPKAALPYSTPTVSRNPDHNGIHIHRKRILQLVELRKKVAQASLRVRAYVRAMTIVRTGWHIPLPPTESSDETASSPPPSAATLTQRLAYDEKHQNTLHNVTSTNEYYEPIVGTDVNCHHTPTINQTTQAFALVACHIFDIPKHNHENYDTYALHPRMDPVQAIPSLRKIIQDNPNVEFVVSTYFKQRPPKHAIVTLFVRILPTGVDVPFDTALERFYNGTQASRNEQLQLFIQLGPGSRLSPLSWAAIKFIGIVMKAKRFRSSQETYSAKRSEDGTVSFPAMIISDYFELRHFGKSLLPKSNTHLPRNYIAVNVSVEADKIQSTALRLFFKKFELNAFTTSIIDFTLVLKGKSNKEFPERALTTKRMVHIHPNVVKLPMDCGAVRHTQIPISEIMYDENDIPIQSHTVPSSNQPPSPLLGSKKEESWFALYPNMKESLGKLFTGSFTAGQTNRQGNNENENRDRFHEDDSESMQRQNHDSQEDEVKSEIDTLIEILDGITVPVRKHNHDLIDGMTPNSIMPFSTPSTLATATTIATKNKKYVTTTATNTVITKDDMVNVPILRNLTKHDLRRFYTASNGDLKTAAVRIVQSAAWRGITFPIDTRVCRIELQSGQFFQQGTDKENNPVFYFRNMCLGPWRKDVDATTFAVLHRLESAIVHWSKISPELRCTIIVVMGSPLEEMMEDDEHNADDAATTAGDASTAEGEVGDENGSASAATSTAGGNSSGSNNNVKKKKKKKKSKGLTQKQRNPFFVGFNPRIDPEEDYYVHTNFLLVQRLHEVISKHYPERLSKMIVVSSKSGGWMKVFHTLSLKTHVKSQRTRDRITRIDSVAELKKYVDESELVTFVGGKALVNPEAFEI